MKGVNLQRISQNSERESLCLTIDIGHLLDYMPVEAKKEFVGYAVAEGELLKILCQEIAGTACDGGEPPTGDIWMGSRTRGEMRAALAPLLGPAVAEELKLAREKADEFQAARDCLRGLAQVHAMRRDATDIDERCDRNRQWTQMWETVDELFPEYAPKPAKPGPAITTSSSC